MNEGIFLLVTLAAFLIVTYTGIVYPGWFDPWHFRLRRAAKVILRTGPLKFPKSPTRYGYRRLQQDAYGTLWQLDGTWRARLQMFVKTHEHEGIVVSRALLVEVVDPSTQQTYFIAVPRWPELLWSRDRQSYLFDITTAKQAVAWTFGLHERDYNPVVET